MKLALPLAAAFLLSAQAPAQTVLRQIGPFDPSFGSRVASPGDVNGDGLAEIAVSSPLAQVAGAFEAGVVDLFSGFDGSPLWQRTGVAVQERFGRRLAAAGDVDGDGVGDLIVGTGGSTSIVHVLSGVDGSSIHSFNAPTLVMQVGGVGDVNNDGRDDVAAGLFDLDQIVQTGVVRVWSGESGAKLHDLGGLAYDTTFGALLAGPGDVDGDGFADVAGGSEFGARIFSGLTGLVIRSLPGSSWEPYDIAPAGDANGDNVPDLLIGEPFKSRVRLVSGSDLSILRQVNGGGEPIGVGLAMLGDTDGDLAGDFAFGRLHGSGPGSVRLASGADGALLFTHAVPNEAPFEGDAVARINDLGNDGVADLVVGHPNGLGGGFVYVLSSACAPGGSRPFCEAGPNSVSSTGAKIGSDGSHSLAAGSFELEAWKLPPNEFGLFIWGREPQQVPVGDGFLCVGSTVHRIHPALSTGATGVASLALNSWNHPFQPGDVIRFQFWYRDNQAGGAGSNMTHGLRVSFCR